MTGLSATIIVALAALGLLAGVGITAIGPGGVLATIGLFALTTLPPATIAGTAILTHVGTGLLGSAAYLHSGQLREPGTRRVALILAGSAVLGTPIGVLINSRVSGHAFGIVLGVFAAVVAALVLYRQHRLGSSEQHERRQPAVLLVGIGVGVALASGIVGVGGPMLAVPLLLAVGTRVLPALAAAGVQSIVIAGIGTLGYLAEGAIYWPLAILIGLPEMCGVVLGWKIARVMPARIATYALVIALLALAPYLALHA